MQRLLRPRERGGQGGIDNVEEIGSQWKNTAVAAAKDVSQKVAAGTCQLNAFPYMRAIRGRVWSVPAFIAPDPSLVRWSPKSRVFSVLVAVLLLLP